MAIGVIFLLFIGFTSSSFVFADELALVVDQSTAMQIVPSLLVRNSPGSKFSATVAERVHIYGLSRMRNLKQFSHSVTVKVLHLNSSLRQPIFEICFHRNLSLGVGMCSSSQWQKVSKGSWAQRMSPFDHKLLDIRMAHSSLGTLELTLQKDFSAYRVVFLVLGTLLITLAPTFSESLIFYYSSAMAVGIILVVLIVLFQGMKLLPTGRGSPLAIFIYSSFIGVGSFLLSYVPRLLRSMLTEMGISEDMYNPLAIFLLLFIALVGAWLGFWVVHKLVLTEEGLIDTTVSQFVVWSIRILGAVMILQCSLDPLLAAEAFVSAIFISSILRKVIRPKVLRRLYRKLRKAVARSHQKSSDHDSSPTDGNYVEHVRKSQYSQDMFLSPPSRCTTQATYNSTVKGSSKKTPSPLTESDTFYSTYHNTPERRKISDDEWKSVTKECTRKGLEELVSSPEFSRWAVTHAERITLAPTEKEHSQTRGWFSWFR
ncbi:hypothetical protein SOVF_160430 [Spinacia oleracea]|uniref:Uncharacterized protein n=1 Tax=Spinacia oleracea TaxID=3562 RepID=A0A9R0K904_SPIOL|nr:uncharacterized protein LOC110800825 [Spinacia oleracea]KNA08685.1 hypothetical protein SOVF_160430 [Spinacia oleracea]